MTIVSDSCHSGGLIDKAKEQIGESTKQKKEQGGAANGLVSGFKNLCKSVEDAIDSRRRPHQEEEEEEEEAACLKSRSLPLQTLIEILKQKTGNSDIDVGKLRQTLFDMFGEDATPKVKKFVKVILTKLARRGQKKGGLLGLAAHFLQQKLAENDEGYATPAVQTQVSSKQEAYAGAAEKALPDSGILISGCQSDQKSVDTDPSGEPSEAYGAMSNAIQMIIAEREGRVSNRELVRRARKLLKKQGFAQRPGLYCSDQHLHAPFLC